ncbi:MAG: BolA family protein [Paracoccaceae bacterium]
MGVEAEIRECLSQAFEPTELQVSDDSEAHRGHAGFQEGGESHFSVRIRSPHFSGLNRVQQHRAVHKALGSIVPRIHALALDIGV